MTEIFLDTANIEDIDKFLSWGIGTGITTNQAIFLKEKGCNFEERAKTLLTKYYPLDVSLEGPNDYDGIIKAAKEYQKWTDENGNNLSNIVIKIPMMKSGDGLRAVKTLSNMGMQTNVTACMTLNQAFLAASAGATYVSLFYNRMADWKYEHLPIYNKYIDVSKEYARKTILETMHMLKENDIRTKLIVGSIRNVLDIQEILTAHPHIITIPPKILKEMPFNEKTESTLIDFDNAWKEFKKAEK